MNKIGFTVEELYELWLNFKDNDDAATILSDFMTATKREAGILIDKFELRYESTLLDCNNRGKAERTRKHI